LAAKAAVVRLQSSSLIEVMRGIG